MSTAGADLQGEVNTSPMRVLMTGVGGPVAVSLIQTINELNPYIVGVDASALAAGAHFVDKFYQVPMAKDRRYIGRLRELCREEHIDCAIISVDEEIAVLAGEDFSPTVMSITNPESTLVCLDKLKFYHHLKNDFNLPPLIGKRITKPRDGRGSDGITVTADGPRELTQAFVEGDEYTVDVLRAKEGEFLAVVPRLRIDTSAGQSIKGRTVKHEALIAVTKRLVDFLGLWGAVNAQWIIDSEGVPWLIEVNPRLAGCMAFSAAAGANIPAALLRLLRGEQVAPMDFKEMTMLRYWSAVYV